MTQTMHHSAGRLDSFRHAFAGWWHVLRTQRNAWIHTFFSVSVVGAGLWLRLSCLEWAVIVLAISAVWVSECVNTALEAMVDLVSPDVHPLARVGKDVAAAAVLIGALASVIIGLLILGPPLWARVWSIIAPLIG